MVLGLPPNVAFSLLAGAAFLCCVPMAMPASHLIALCGDLGMAPARGALMLSLLLTCAFISRQFWGWLSDRIGGLKTLVIGSLAQAAATAGFVFTQDEAGLFAVAAAFGLGFAGLIPAYILTARQLFPAQRGELARADDAADGHVRHGGRELARRRDLRPLRLLCAGIRHRPGVQSRQLRRSTTS